jgi:hypothetical protein
MLLEERRTFLRHSPPDCTAGLHDQSRRFDHEIPATQASQGGELPADDGLDFDGRARGRLVLLGVHVKVEQAFRRDPAELYGLIERLGHTVLLSRWRRTAGADLYNVRDQWFGYSAAQGGPVVGIAWRRAEDALPDTMAWVRLRDRYSDVAG